MKNWRVIIPIVLIILLCVVPTVVYFAVPVIQPCALLAQVLPPNLLPPNPNVVDPSFTPLPGARAIYGQYACSGYRIEVPNNWNGDLLMYAHGFRGASSELTITPPPVRELAISQGFAWAASSYRANGYNPEDGVADTQMLVDIFKQKVNTPTHIFIYGSSMGGAVVIGSLEQHPDVYQGGLAECGAIGGAGQLDYLLGLNMLADYFAGTDMFAPENRSLQGELNLLNDKVYPALLQPAPFSLPGTWNMPVEPAPAITLTVTGDAFRDGTIFLGGGHRPFAQEGFAASSGIIMYAPRALSAVTPKVVDAATNETTVYQIDPGYGVDSNTLNEQVRRRAATPAARAIYAFTGNLKVPLLTLHDTGDNFVPIENEQVYRRLVEAQGNGNLLVQRAIRRFVHCDFSIQERTRAWNDLVAWVKNGVKPDGEDLMGSLENAGIQWTEPLRPDDPGHE